MYSYNRRQYINREPENKIEKNIPEKNENSNNEDLKSLFLGSLKLLLENYEEIKNSIKKLDVQITSLSQRISSLENHFDNNDYLKKIQIQPVFDEIKPKFEDEIKSKLETVKSMSANDEANQTNSQNSMPMMPGSGFSNITADYLRNLNKKR